MYKDLNRQTETVPIKKFKEIGVGLVFIILACFYNNYAVAATLSQVSEFTDSTHSSVENKSWETLDNHAHVIVYRDDHNSSLPESVLNIFVNSQYHTSVLSHTRAVDLSLCPGNQEINIALSKNDHRLSQRPVVNVMSPALQAGEDYYFKVSLNDQGKIATRWVSEKEAKVTLGDLKPQMRTLSRVNNEEYCPEAIYTIDSKSIFSQQNNETLLSAEGIHALHSLVEKINSEFYKIDKVVVRDFSDVHEKIIDSHPFSQMRANSVATWLTNSGLPSPSFSAQGMDLYCSKKSAGKNNFQACLDIRRGVHVEIYGVRK